MLLDEHGVSWREHARNDLTAELGTEPNLEQIDERAAALHQARMGAAEAYLKQF